MSTEVAAPFDPHTLEILERRRRAWTPPSRGWLIRRALVAADLVGLTAAFGVALWIYGTNGGGDYGIGFELLLLAATLPVWVVVGRLSGLYDHDEERTNHSTADELAGVLHLVTLGAWLVFAVTWLAGASDAHAPRMITFWGLAIVLVGILRALARGMGRGEVKTG
jgi:hypothetical protein